jgi:hypothetical protein
MLYDCQYFFRGLLNVQGEKLKNICKKFFNFYDDNGGISFVFNNDIVRLHSI